MLFIESTASTASLSDEDAVYLIDVVGGLHICKRHDPLLFVRAINLHVKTETMTIVLRALR